MRRLLLRRLDDERVRKETDEKRSIAGKGGYRNWRFVVFRNIKERQAKEELIEHWVEGEQFETSIERSNTPRTDGTTNAILQVYHCFWYSKKHID